MSQTITAATARSAASPTAVTTRGRRVDRPLTAFLLATYLLPWTVWCSQIAHDHGLIGWHLPNGIALWTLVPVTLTALARTGGRSALADYSRSLVRARVPFRWWAAALGLPVAFAALATGAGEVASGTRQLGVTLAAPAAASYLLVGLGLFTLTEESAWRGFALPRLLTHMQPRTASLFLGVVWAGWHLPTFALATESDSRVPYAGFAVMVVATSIITAWLYLNSGRSLLLCGVFHAVADAAYAYTGVIGRDHHPFWAAVALEVLTACYLALRSGPSLQATARTHRR
jgi:membrane protease YdiL (CAAX protease family)